MKIPLLRSLAYLHTNKLVSPVCTQFPHGQLTCLTRNLSTSEKKKETSSINIDDITHATEESKRKNWISYGFDDADEAEDRGKMHRTFFMGISVMFGLCGLYMAYCPDYQMKDWAVREAYIELRRREREGLKLIDPNYVPVDQIVLPTEEELGNTPIII